ncbi:SWIM zinc finger family protein [Rhodohalobacter sulfatireducens]|uniref:SWIM zinc finger family protein n=1 Tax=Rhodohalobacter sulfatireducens TaxID=2911366 RepID=A0ABS9KJP3_9BACT|nr:SWIM zinc finger family protein [Rhodohalobacter sulfatireducens]MCG2591058.1 SWIM zinc finger family protein [Rhodohalobacter sulfatireducens]
MSFLINPKKLEDHFRPVILDRARHYFATGAIRNMAQSENNTWMAEVQGTEVYLVTIKQENSDLCECRCTCPYALEDACKHIAAVLMEIENDENEIQILDEETEKQPTPAYSSGQLDKALARSDKSQLAAFISQIAEFEPHIEHQFLSFMAASDPKTGKAQYRKLVKSALAPARRKGLIYGHEARQHLASVYKLLEQADKKKPAVLFALCWIFAKWWLKRWCLHFSLLTIQMLMWEMQSDGRSIFCMTWLKVLSMRMIKNLSLNGPSSLSRINGTKVGISMMILWRWLFILQKMISKFEIQKLFWMHELKSSPTKSLTGVPTIIWNQPSFGKFIF